MRCAKCKGLMVTARFSDYYQICYEWRCLNCGAIVFPPSIDRFPSVIPITKRRPKRAAQRACAHGRTR
jgi:hypothetical protein